MTKMALTRACLVSLCVCSLLVITWFPACIVIHEKYVVQRQQGFMAARCCGCLFPICGNQWGLGTGEDVEVISGRDDSGSNVDKLRGPERFFHSTWYSVLKRRPVRLGIIAVFTGMATVGIVLAGTKVQVTKRPTTESILKKSHPLQKTFDLLRGVDPAFKAADSAQKEVGYWAYGLDFKDPIDRTGTDPLGNGVNGDEITFAARSGVARYAGSDMTSEAFQAKVVEDCSKIENLTSVYRPTTGGRGEIYCFMHDFKTYLESNRRTFPVASHTLVDELLAWQRNKLCTGVGCYKNRLGTGVTQGRENGGLYEKGTGFSADGKTIKFMYIGANMSIPRTNLDLAIIVPEYEEWRDSALKENREDVALGVEAIGLTGRALWIATMDALVSGVITAVPTSVGLSFVVLTVTTGNWQVAAIATITIVGVMGCFFLTFVAQAQTLGVYESMFLSLTAGFAVDYVVHLAHAYNEADASDRCDKMQHSLTAMGVSVVSGAISTLMASMMLFICSFNFFSTYGSFIFFVIFWSLVWAMLFFPAAMMTIGPNGTAPRPDAPLLIPPPPFHAAPPPHGRPNFHHYLPSPPPTLTIVATCISVACFTARRVDVHSQMCLARSPLSSCSGLALEVAASRSLHAPAAVLCSCLPPAPRLSRSAVVLLCLLPLLAAQVAMVTLLCSGNCWAITIDVWRTSCCILPQPAM